jgi:hypothetical protein
MKQYSGWQWLLIDAANNFGHDKLLFEDRIDWATTNLERLEELADQAETKPLYLKAVMAIRKAQKQIPTGHLVGVDACCSGIQIMSALTGCIDGARSTGMVDPNVRADAYSKTTQVMNGILGGQLSISRKNAKDALMTSFYGSKAKPKEIFGEDTPELAAFYQAAQQVAPGAWELLQDLLDAWQPWALVHGWKLPDGFDARVKVMEKKEARIEIDELDHASFTYEFYENKGSKAGISLPANVTHSMDAYVLREMHRRCNYNQETIQEAAGVISLELMERAMGAVREASAIAYSDHGDRVDYYRDQFKRATLASAVILPYLDAETVQMLSTPHLEALAVIVNGMLAHKPFGLITVHDEFKAHANNVNHVRAHYREILAEIADSHVLDDILSQIHGVQGKFNKLSSNLGELIRGSEYALC